MKSKTKTEDVYNQAFAQFVHSITPDFERGKVFDMSSLVRTYREVLKEIAAKLKKRMSNYFGDNISFHKSSVLKEPDLVYHRNADMQSIINHAVTLKCQIAEDNIATDLGESTDAIDHHNIVHTAMNLRSSVRDMKGISTNPAVNPCDISIERAEKCVPDELYEFLGLLMFGKKAADIRTDDSLHMQVLAVGQDIAYSASNSRCKTPKHVGVAISAGTTNHAYT